MPCVALWPMVANKNEFCETNLPIQQLVQKTQLTGNSVKLIHDKKCPTFIRKCGTPGKRPRLHSGIGPVIHSKSQSL